MDGQERFAGTHFLLASRDSRLHIVMESEVVLIIHLFIYSVRLYFSAKPSLCFSRRHLHRKVLNAQGVGLRLDFMPKPQSLGVA
jgi:hypothetical protein